MIPTDHEELDVLAGEYVLGLLDLALAQEVASAVATHAPLRDAISFWEQRLHPLSAFAELADPPPGTWDVIATQLNAATAKPTSARSGSDAAPWRWSTAGFAAVAAALFLYIVLTPSAPPLVAVLRPPQTQAANWIATMDRDGLRLSAIERQTPPATRVFELWGIAGPAARPVPLGLIPSGGSLRLARLPRGIGAGATLAISIEPPGGSPTGLPTGPVVFMGSLRAS